MIEICKFLLQEGMEYVLTERFCQDPVEEYSSVAKENWGEEMITQISAHLDTMTIPFVSKGQYLVTVETQEEDKINAGHGSK